MICPTATPGIRSEPEHTSPFSSMTKRKKWDMTWLKEFVRRVANFWLSYDEAATSRTILVTMIAVS